MYPYWDDFGGMRHIPLPIHDGTRTETLSQEAKAEKRMIFELVQTYRKENGLSALLNLGKKAGFTDFQTLNMLEGQKVPMCDWRKMYRVMTSSGAHTKERKRA